MVSLCQLLTSHMVSVSTHKVGSTYLACVKRLCTELFSMNLTSGLTTIMMLLMVVVISSLCTICVWPLF